MPESDATQPAIGTGPPSSLPENASTEADAPTSESNLGSSNDLQSDPSTASAVEIATNTANANLIDFWSIDVLYPDPIARPYLALPSEAWSYEYTYRLDTKPELERRGTLTIEPLAYDLNWARSLRRPEIMQCLTDKGRGGVFR